MPKGTASGPSEDVWSAPTESECDQRGERTGDDGEEEDHAHLARTQPCGDGCGELHVAQAEALPVANQCVNPAQYQQGQRGGCRGDGGAQSQQKGRVPGIGRAAMQLSDEGVAGAIKNAQPEQRQGERVWQLHRFGIADRQSQQQRAEEGERDAFEVKAGEEDAANGKRGDSEFYKGITPSDALLAFAATAAQQNEAEERDIVVCGDRCAAGGAVRGRPHDGSMPRQTADADVQKAAEGKAEEQRKDDLEGQHCSRSAPWRSTTDSLGKYSEAGCTGTRAWIMPASVGNERRLK